MIPIADVQAREVRAFFGAFADDPDPGIQRLRAEAAEGGWTLERARTAVREHMAGRIGAGLPAVGASIVAGRDGLQRWHEGASLLVRVRGGVYEAGPAGLEQRKREETQLRRSEFSGFTLLDLARSYLQASGVSLAGMTRDQIARTAITRAGIISHSPSDFTDVLTTTAEAAMGVGYEETPETWRSWVEVKSMDNFNEHEFPVLSTFDGLSQVVNDGEYTYGSFEDKAEKMTLATYGKLFSIGRRAIVNDRLGAFTDIPRLMGRAAARKVGDLAYGVLTANALMNEDATALFDASTHTNLTASGTAISVTSLDVAWALMRKQTDPNGNTIGILPTYLIVPVAKANIARTTVMAEKDPSVASGESPNPFQNRFQVVEEHRLDANSGTAWYLAASAMQVGTVAVGFLEGRQAPFLEQQEGFTRDGVIYKVRHDVTAGAMDYRGLYKNAGA